jgi:cadmium resistance protein CadD (predicted permease)
MYTIIAVTAGLFIGTNLDNLALLVALYSRYRDRPGAVTTAYISGATLVILIFFAVGKGGDLIPVSYLGLLGIIPIIIGVTSLIRLFLPQKAGDTGKLADADDKKAVFVAVLLTQLSNSTDTIIAFSVLLADSTARLDYFITATFLAMALLFSALAKYSVGHPTLSVFLDRFGRYVTPFILILAGWYILADTATDLA